MGVEQEKVVAGKQLGMSMATRGVYGRTVEKARRGNGHSEPRANCNCGWYVKTN